MSNAKQNAIEDNILADLSVQDDLFAGDEPKSERLQRAVRQRRQSSNPAEIEALNTEIQTLTEQLGSALLMDDGGYSFRRFRMTSTSIILPEALTIEEANDFGYMLAGMEDALNWWRGDWANLYVEGIDDPNKRGEEYDKLAESFNMNSRTLRNCASIARKVEVSRRRDTLSFTHHVEVAPLTPAEQDTWLTRAEEGDNGKRWSVATLRKAIKASIPTDDDDLPSPLQVVYKSQSSKAKSLVKQGINKEKVARIYEQIAKEIREIK